MTSYDILFRGARVLVEDRLGPSAVGVSEGRVAAIGALDDAVAQTTVELADDEVLLPGLVDTHVHVNEPGRTDWEGFASATRAAAAGGVTTIVDMPLNSIPPTIDVASLAVKRAAATGQCHVDVGFWGGAVPSNLGGLAELCAAGVFGVKCFLLDSGVPEFPPLSRTQLERALGELAQIDALLIVHAEDAETIDEGSYGGGRSYADFVASRPPGSEQRAVEIVVEAARRTGARVHIVHVSSADVISVLRAARADGVRITAETCPHYLTLVAEEIGDGKTEFKCCPPIRESLNRDRLWDALSEGVIELVVSDHSPSTPEMKLLGSGDFGAAWGGISSLQLGLPLVWTEARRRGHSLAEAVRWMTRGPAQLVAMPRKGAITVGNDADLVVFAPDQTFTVDAAALHHRHPTSPYHGRTLSGVVRATYLRGKPVTGADPRGTFLTPVDERI